MWQRPVVHSGFLRCWREDGLHLRIVQCVLALAAAWEADHPGQSVPVLVTGRPLKHFATQFASSLKKF